MLRNQKKIRENASLLLVLGNVMHLASAKWTRRMGFKPHIDAVHMEAVVAFGQFPAPLTPGDIVKAHCAVKGVHFARIRLEGEEVLVATTPFEQEIDDEEEDDHNGEDCWVVCFGGECGCVEVLVVFHFLSC